MFMQNILFYACTYRIQSDSFIILFFSLQEVAKPANIERQTSMLHRSPESLAHLTNSPPISTDLRTSTTIPLAAAPAAAAGQAEPRSVLTWWSNTSVHTSRLAKLSIR